jgi:hypothetical protein
MSLTLKVVVRNRKRIGTINPSIHQTIRTVDTHTCIAQDNLVNSVHARYRSISIVAVLTLASGPGIQSYILARITHLVSLFVKTVALSNFRILNLLICNLLVHQVAVRLLFHCSIVLF